MFSSKPEPAITPEDLGVDLEEDSEDFTEEERTLAVDTLNAEDFAAKLLQATKEANSIGVPKHELRRRAGILFSRVTFENGVKAVFRIDWLRRRS